MTPPCSAYDRARADRRFLARFAAAYRGPHPALDALWWLEHPGETAPDGTAAPGSTLRRSRQALYGRAVDEEAAARYERAAAALAADEALARSALLVAESGDAGAAEPARLPAASTLPTAPTRAPTADARRRVPRWLLFTAIPAVGVVALGVGVGVGGSARPPAYQQPGPGSSGTAAALPTTLPAPTAPVWGESLDTASGTGSRGPSGTLDAGGRNRMSTVECQGAGSLQVSYSDGSWSNYPCGASAPRHTVTYEDHATERFSWSVAVSGDVVWALTVSAVGSR